MMLYLNKETVKSSRILSYFYLRLFDKSRLPSLGQIAVCGFPRSGSSGNTYMARVVMRGCLKNVVLVNHFHSAAQLIRSVRLGLPTFLRVRNVEDNIVSLYIGSEKEGGGRPSLTALFLRYLLCHLRILHLREKIMIIDLEESKSDPSVILNTLKAKYPVATSDCLTSNDILESIRHDMKPGKELMSSSSNSDKELLKKQVRPLVLRHPLVTLAGKVYKLLTSTSK